MATRVAQVLSQPAVFNDASDIDTQTLLLEALRLLDRNTKEVFGRIETRVQQERSRLTQLNDRIQVVRKKVERLSQGTRRATTIYAPSKYPVPETPVLYHSVYEGMPMSTGPADLGPLPRPSSSGSGEAEEEPVMMLESDDGSSFVPRTRVHLLQQYARVRLTMTLDDARREVEALGGLGPLPPQLGSVSSVLLFNSTENPYKQYNALDNLVADESTRRNKRVEDTEGEEDGLGAAPALAGDDLPMLAGLDFGFKPKSKEFEDLALPDNLDLPNLAEIAWRADDTTADGERKTLLPSAFRETLPALPSIADYLEPTLAITDAPRAGGAAGGGGAPAPPPPPPPAATAAPPPPPASAAPPPPPPSAAPVAAPAPAPASAAAPPPPPPVSGEGESAGAPAANTTTAVVAKPEEEEESGGGGGGGGGGGMMAMLAEIQKGKKLKKVEAGAEGGDGDRPAPKKPLPPPKMSMMDELANRLLRQRKHMGGAAPAADDDDRRGKKKGGDSTDDDSDDEKRTVMTVRVKEVKAPAPKKDEKKEDKKDEKKEGGAKDSKPVPATAAAAARRPPKPSDDDSDDDAAASSGDDADTLAGPRAARKPAALPPKPAAPAPAPASAAAPAAAKKPAKPASDSDDSDESDDASTVVSRKPGGGGGGGGGAAARPAPALVRAAPPPLVRRNTGLFGSVEGNPAMKKALAKSTVMSGDDSDDSGFSDDSS